MAFHNELGKQGEEIACEFLRKKGFLILERNWRYHKAEIDIIAFSGNKLVFVEIKTRSRQAHAAAEDTIGTRKLRVLYEAADAYVQLKQIPWEVRYDLVTVIHHGDSWSVEHEPEAFYPFMNL